MKDDILFNNYLLTRLVGSRMIQVFQANGFNYKPEHFMIMILLDSKKRMSQKEIGEGSIRGKAVISRAIDLLEKQGIVRRIDNEVDARERLVELTEQGKDLFEDMKTVFLKMEAEFLESVADPDRIKSVKVLKTMIASK